MEEKILYHVIRRAYHTDFYSDTNMLFFDVQPPKRVPKSGKFVLLRTSTKENDYVENFANKVTSVSSLTKSCKVTRNGDKLSIKLYSGNKKRTVGYHYFRQHKNIWYLTVNLKTGDMYVGSIQNFNTKRKRVSRVRRNNFYSSEINTFLFVLKDFFANIVNDKEVIKEEVQHIFNVFKSELLSEFEIQGFIPSSPIKLLYPFYLTKKGVKFPNNVHVFSDSEEDFGHLPTLKEFRKTKMKYIDALMLKNGFTGDKVKKYLHSTQSYRMEHYRIAVGLFGIDWIHQDDELLKKLITNPSLHRYYSNLGKSNNMFRFDVSLAEKKRAFTIFKKFINSDLSLATFLDHIRFLDDLKRLGEDVKWESRNEEEFNREHIFFTDLKRSHTKGTFTRIYSDGFFNSFTSIKHEDEEYKPLILRTSGEFSDESTHQSNCVRTYIDSANSFIISLRKNKERATVEYKIFMDEKNRVRMERVQYLARHNKPLDESWATPLIMLDNMVNNSLKKFNFTMKLFWETKKQSKTYKLVRSGEQWVKFVDDDGNAPGNNFGLDFF